MSTMQRLAERFGWPDGSYVDQDDNPRDVVLVGDWTQVSACHWRGPMGSEAYIPDGTRFIVTGTALWEVDPTWAQHPSAILGDPPAEPPEGWRWIDGVLAHRDGRVATIGAFGMACHRRGSDEPAMLPLDVARYLLAWRERGEVCPDCGGDGWSSESNPGTGQGGRDEQVAVPCPRGCPDCDESEGDIPVDAIVCLDGNRVPEYAWQDLCDVLALDPESHRRLTMNGRPARMTKSGGVVTVVAVPPGRPTE